MKKFICIFFILYIVAIFSACGVSENISWEIEDGTLTIDGEGNIGNFCSGFDENEGIYEAEGSYEIPWQNEDYDTLVLKEGITEISEHSFGGAESLEKVVINGEEVSVRHAAFYECTNLREIENFENVSRVFTHAFCGCTSLETLNFGESLKVLERSAFKDCTGLNEVFFSEGFSFEQSAPNSFADVFEGCTSLEKITVDENNSIYSDVDGVLYSKSKEDLIYYPQGKKDETFNVPAEVKCINKSAFYQNFSIKTLAFEGESIPSIELSAFESCSLESIRIAPNVTNFNNYNFDKKITILCEEGSAAHQYAVKRNIPFVLE